MIPLIIHKKLDYNLLTEHFYWKVRKTGDKGV